MLDRHDPSAAGNLDTACLCSPEVVSVQTGDIDICTARLPNRPIPILAQCGNNLYQAITTDHLEMRARPCEALDKIIDFGLVDLSRPR